jgi:hypothetical protein
MGPEVSLLCSKEKVYFSCPEPNKRSQSYSLYSFRSILILSSKIDLGFLSCLFTYVSATTSLYTCDTLPAYITSLVRSSKLCVARKKLMNVPIIPFFYPISSFSYIQTPSSVTPSYAPLIYLFPLMGGTKFHTRAKQQAHL